MGGDGSDIVAEGAEAGGERVGEEDGVVAREEAGVEMVGERVSEEDGAMVGEEAQATKGRRRMAETGRVGPMGRWWKNLGAVAGEVAESSLDDDGVEFGRRG